MKYIAKHTHTHTHTHTHERERKEIKRCRYKGYTPKTVVTCKQTCWRCAEGSTMLHNVSRNCCCLCGKRKSTHPNIVFHLFPKDAKRRQQWVQTLNIAYVKHTQVVCEDHFVPHHIGSKGHLLSTAVPIPTNGSEGQTSSSVVHTTEQQASSGVTASAEAQNVAETDHDASTLYELPSYDLYASGFGRLEEPCDVLLPALPLSEVYTSLAQEPSQSSTGYLHDEQDCFGTEFSVLPNAHQLLLHPQPQEELLPLQPCEEDDNLGNDPEDTEYSSDDDFAFWQKMKRHAKRRGKKSSRNKLFAKYMKSSHQSNLRNSHINIQRCSDQQSSSTKEGNKTSDKVNSVVKGSENDDWITDDEVDDEDHENIELAFKREFEEKRLPPNSKEKNFVCKICGKAYSKHSFLRAHIVKDHKEHEEAKRYPYFCQHCKKVYVKEKDLLKHQQQFSGPCEICGVVLGCSDLFWVHRRDHDSVCKVCNKEFRKMSSLYIHMNMKHSKKGVSCPVCDKRFRYKSLIKKHIAKVHDNSELTRYKCDSCDFSVMTQRALKIHQSKVHGSKLDLFTCKKCKKTFSTKLTYKNHVAIHVRKSNIICPLCSKKFISQEELQTHRISVHEVTDRVDSRKGTLSSHLNSSHLSHYVCALCNITLSSNEDMSQHMHKYHDMDIDSPREIRLEIERVHLSEIDENAKGVVQAVGNEETYLQKLDKPTNGDFSTHFGSSSGRSALLVPASAMPPNVNMVEVNGVQYHVIRENQQH
ncbi:zinc finger protein 600-like isoform X2 [Scylla paramamosain]|uniref:zinc finger protein 600-like isoform X2 n=1 Tax=Scylla paramamosain TaxID=85552 RepID=UPI0030827491